LSQVNFASKRFHVRTLRDFAPPGQHPKRGPPGEAGPSRPAVCISRHAHSTCNSF